MSIQAGDKIPSATLQTMGEKGPQPITTDEIFNGKKVVLFAVPGAFTPGCSMTHLPGFVVNADTIKAKGVDTIACISVNDAFVMGAWGKSQNAEEILMLGDGNGDFAKALGLSMDASGWGMGTRSQRYAMIVDNGVVTHLGVDASGGIELSSAETVLQQL
ncbi:peroxiredoxin [Spongiibacter sp. KMU-158]|uniref:Glutathione-dependent peroxiredoxin n=1 Tax=Spongiibacter pelagi TaxID=2760804 RepID=A0A927GUT8_9GAMM|nr:peroxiredoxin [Spongiibacter pelagi]MBD2857675.1 peroxiredoxin [Spongiibacter pelagi]